MSDLQNEKMYFLLKHSKNAPATTINACKKDLKNGELDLDLKSGIAFIKQVELYKKWRGYIPIEYQDEIYPKPPDDILKNVKQENQKRRRGKGKQRRKN